MKFTRLVVFALSSELILEGTARKERILPDEHTHPEQEILVTLENQLPMAASGTYSVGMSRPIYSWQISRTSTGTILALFPPTGV